MGPILPMSEEAKKTEDAPKKKGGKLPILIALIVVIAGGGFFGMQKMNGGKTEEKPKIELGEIVTTKEFLCNLSDPSTYVRTELAFQMAKGYDAKHFTDIEPAVRDTVNIILGSKSQAEISSAAGKDSLKKEIAAAVNEILLAGHEEEDKKDEHPAEEGEPKPEEPAVENHEPVEIPKGWDSGEGPVLRVFFTSFATQ